MKKIILAVLLMTAASTSQAATDHETCVAVQGIAKAVMKNRQTGVGIDSVMGIANNAGKLKPLITDIVITAYDSPKFSTSDYQEEAITEFGNSYYIDCIKNK